MTDILLLEKRKHQPKGLSGEKNSNPKLPDFYFNCFVDIDFDLLKSKGYTNLIIDVDNTIAVKGATIPVENAGNKIRELLRQENAWKVCLVSNIVLGKKREERVAKIADSINVPWVAAWLFDMKPNPTPFLKAMKILDSKAENTVVIGDQMFTDIVGGNKLGLLTVLVNPLGTDHWTTNLTGRRNKEKRILKENGIECVIVIPESWQRNSM